jgi:hypothetical protein
MYRLDANPQTLRKTAYTPFKLYSSDAQES